MHILGQMFGGVRGHTLLEPWHLGLAAVALIAALAEEKLGWYERLMTAPAPAYACAMAALLFCLEVFGVIDAAIPFIYFQF
jgi:hypothetical protein